MATFEEHIEGLTQIDITSTSSPTQAQLTGFLVDGVIDVVNKFITYKPEELSKFSKTTNATDSVAKKGKILSVLREHDSTTILRPCTPIPPQLRYEATDVESLYYRSKFNPGYYERDGLIITVPEASASGNNDIVVTQVHYDTGLINSDEYNGGVIENFPLDYEYLVALYAAGKSCQSAAGDIQNNMPTVPTVPSAPIFDIDDTELPSLPVLSTPQDLTVNFSKLNSSIQQEDFDKADKEMDIIQRQIDIYQKKVDIANNDYSQELEIFKQDSDMKLKNSDREFQIMAGEYGGEINKFKNEISNYAAEVQEKVAKYKWFIEQYLAFNIQYNQAFGISQKPRRKEQETQQRRKRNN